MEVINNKKFKKVILRLGIVFSLILSMAISVNAASTSKTISTDRGSMQAWASGFYLAATAEKGTEYGSKMLNGNTTKLYLSSSTVEYVSGASVSRVARWGGAGRKEINDYFYLKGYSKITLKTYSAHEAIYTSAYTAQLAQTY